jgi:mannose-6-phosphate isomerase-like protein (cupin superfamily)
MISSQPDYNKMINLSRLTVAAAGTPLLLLSVLWAQNNGQPGSQTVWAPKPAVLTPWTAPNKPHWKLSEVLEAHKGQKSWKIPIVRDEFLRADYIQMAPGERTPRRAHPDTREWWVVQDGEIRFTIDGQKPFVAKKGYLVQVPYRTFYTMETVGDKPSLRFEVNIAGARTMYPAEDKPPMLDGYTFVKTTVASKGTYDQGNRPYIDFDSVMAGTEKQRRFIADDRAVSNIIIGDAKSLPPVTDADKGHFHAECAEFWFILEGKMDYKIEGTPQILADQGDIVYAPRGHWHRPRFAGEGQACRLAMNGFQDIAHYFEPKEK